MNAVTRDPALLAVFLERMGAYCDALKADHDVGGNTVPCRFSFDMRDKYAKVVMEHAGSKSVHSFVLLSESLTAPRQGSKGKAKSTFKFGDIIKAASFNAPALNFARGNVMEEDFGGKKAVNWAGL